MDLRFDGKVQVNVFLDLLPIEWVILRSLRISNLRITLLRRSATK